jgi:hypothetical protein
MAELPVLPFRGREEYVDRKPGKHTNRPRGWLPGWPDGVPYSQLAVVEVERPLDGRVFKVRVDRRLAEHVGLFLAMIQEVGHPLIGAGEVNVEGGKQGGVGSYANRPIKTNDDRRIASEHSRGKALDLWTLSNPQRFTDRPHRLRSTWHPLAVRIAVAGDFEHGIHFHDMSSGTYSDPMHVQYRLRPEDVPGSTQRMVDEYERIRAELEPEEPDDMTPEVRERIKALQRFLNERGANPPLEVDGDFGRLTEAALLQVRTQLGFADAELEALAGRLGGARTAFGQLEADTKAEDNAAFQRQVSMATLKEKLG